MDKKLINTLFWLRISVALVLIMWTIDKIINVEHAARVYEHFYKIPGLADGSLMIMIGVAELILIALFLIGRFKNITYLIVLIIHGVSTLSTYAKFMTPFGGSNLLFFTAWPMLAACWMLYVFREQDTKYNL